MSVVSEAGIVSVPCHKRMGPKVGVWSSNYSNARISLTHDLFCHDLLSVRVGGIYWFLFCGQDGLNTSAPD